MAALVVLGAPSGANSQIDDWWYPAEEASEHAAAAVPVVVSIAADMHSAVLKSPSTGATATVSPPSMAFTHWHVVAIATCSDAASGTAPCVVMERNFNRWGLMALGTAPGSTVPSSTLRKGVGDLASMQQPWFNFTGSDPEYFEKIENALVDYAAQQAATRTTDGQLTFSSIASTLAPQRDIVEIGNAADVVKFVVVHTGRVKCAVRKNTATLTEGGITELQNQHSPPPNAQTLVFDPAKHVSYWPERFQATKTTLVGGHLNIANVGSFSTSVSKGFELVAFVPEADMQPVGPATEAATCQYSAAIKNAYIADYTPGGRVTAPTLPAAQAACDANIDCGGITLRYGAYELRAASYTQPSTVGEVSWLVLNSSKPACHAMPRIDGVNYAPGVFIRLREQLSQTWGAADSISYFWVTNATAQSPMVVNASVFYGALSKHTANVRSLLAPTIDVTLPGAEGARQVDTAKFGLLSAMSNFIGNQPNYGNGGTYWSIGREDNGSLPLDFLTVDDALLDWGMLEVAREHVGFYLDNYVRDDGTVNYYTWGDLGDSVGDTGRIVSVFLKVVRLGGDSGTAKAWATHYLPKAQALGRLMLREIAAQQSVPPPDGCQGLLQGAPEHDWSSVTNLYFYNNNAWVMRGLHELGTYLSSGTAPLNATGGAAMLTAAAKLLGDIQASVKKCLVFAHDGTPFLPPNAEIGATPFQNMTGDRTSSYSNFRFFSETLLADIMPRDVEGGWLTYHNERGGRAGGANRFMSWLDDMPTAGWGYGALTSNRTDDFLALLYGHMATYQSRGSFHSTEQLSFQGEGLYRSFLHWNEDPLPPPAKRQQLVVETRVGGPEYYGSENDVSFCIVTQVLAARLTRWQIVFEDLFRPAITGERPAVWLARGAPSRWFSAGAGFSAASVPTAAGMVSYTVSVPTAGKAQYNVTVDSSSGDLKPLWKLRWPGALSAAPTVSGCSIVAVDLQGGIAAVEAQEATFMATSAWTNPAV